MIEIKKEDNEVYLRLQPPKRKGKYIKGEKDIEKYYLEHVCVTSKGKEVPILEYIEDIVDQAFSDLLEIERLFCTFISMFPIENQDWAEKIFKPYFYKFSKDKKEEENSD